MICNPRRRLLTLYRAEWRETWTLLLVVVVVLASACLATFFPDRDLDTLGCEALAEICTIAYTWELLGRVDLEDITEH